MIVKGNQRAGGGQLAAHLMNALDNETVELAETRGSIANDLRGAFSEWHADSKTTNCTKYLYSLSVNPDQSQGRMTREQYFEFLDRVEERLGLAGQPRVVVFHVKRDRDGTPRQHCHAVWSRIDTRRGRAVPIAHDRVKLRSVAQGFARELGRSLPAGMSEDAGQQQRPDVKLQDRQQEERTGISKADHVAALTAAWVGSSDGAGLVQKLRSAGYILARGDRRAYVVVDRAGEPHSLARRVEGIKTADVKARLALSHPLDNLPSVDEARAQQLQRRQVVEAASPAPPDRTADERRDDLEAMQAERRQQIEQQRQAMQARHTAERRRLTLHQQRRTGANDNPLRGIAGLVRRARSTLTDRQQTDILEQRQKAELKDLAREGRGLTVLDARERRSLENHIGRRAFGRFVALAKRFEALIERTGAQIAARTTQRLDLRQALRTALGKQPAEQKPASPLQAAFAEKAVGITPEQEAARAAERLRQQEPARPTPKLRPGH